MKKIQQPEESSFTSWLDFVGWASILLGFMLGFIIIFAGSSFEGGNYSFGYLLMIGGSVLLSGVTWGAIMLVLSHTCKTAHRVEWLLINKVIGEDEADKLK